MTIGLSLIHSILAEGSRNLLREVRRDWLTEQELPVYEFVTRHVSLHGDLPQLETVRASGFNLTPITEPVSYYIDEARNRAFYGTIQAQHGPFFAAVQRRDMDTARDMLSMMLTSLREIDNRYTTTTMVDLAQRVMERYDQAHAAPGEMRGITLGYDYFNAMTSGAQAGDVIVVVGRPSVGKSYMLLNMVHEAVTSGHSAVVVSMEMGLPQIASRLIAINSGISPRYIMSGQLSTYAERDVRASTELFGRIPPIHFLAGELRRTVGDVDTLVQEARPDILYIDAGYLLKPERQTRNQQRRELISEVIEEIKHLALARQLPIVVTVQFNRSVSSKKRTGASQDLDLDAIAESDVIGQVASIIAGLRFADPPHHRNRRVWEIVKNREGEIGKFITNYSFQPVDFSYIDEVVERQEVARLQTQHML